MKSVDRGMVKYAPYQSLVEQSVALSRMRANRERQEKKILSSDQAEEINEILTHYQGEVIRVSFYRMGRTFEEEGTIDRIDLFERTLYVNGVRITLTSLQSLERK